MKKPSTDIAQSNQLVKLGLDPKTADFVWEWEEDAIYLKYHYNDKNGRRRVPAWCKWIDRIKFGCDTHKQIEDCERAIALLERFGYRGDFMLFTMIGGKNDFAECFERINYWRERLIQSRRDHTAHIYPYAQPYRDPTKTHHEIPMWQKDMAYWCNKHMVFWSTDFKDFEPRKNFRCKEYFK